MPRSFSSVALSISSKLRASALPFSASTLVMAAVRVVLPWSMWPMVPTFTCGLSRSNFSFATFGSLLYRLGCSPCGRSLRNLSNQAPRWRAGLCGDGLPGALLDDLLGDVRRDLLVGLELHRVVGPPLGVGAQVGRVAEHLAQWNPRRDGERV